MNLENTDTFLSIVQRLAIVGGIVVAGWQYFYHEEGSPHLKINAEPQLHKTESVCHVYVPLEFQNLGSSVWEIKTVVGSLFDPGTEDPMEIAAPVILAPAQKLRSNETAGFGLPFKGPLSTTDGYAIFKLIVTLNEEGDEWPRVLETDVSLAGCQS